jgi:hypothetical protein
VTRLSAFSIPECPEFRWREVGEDVEAEESCRRGEKPQRSRPEGRGPGSIEKGALGVVERLPPMDIPTSCLSSVGTSAEPCRIQEMGVRQ